MTIATHTRFLASIGALLILAAILLPAAARAHEPRPTVGKYQFVVGFLTEPAIEGQMNGLDLRVTIPDENGKAVEGLEKTMKAEVIVGGGAQSMPLTLAARFGQPGAYAAYFMPTRPGSYIFHITGTIDGQAVDERFESGPGRFNDVQSAVPLQFPDKLPEPVATGKALRAVQSDAAQARTLGLAGMIIGAAGIVVGTLALATRRRDGQDVARPEIVGPGRG